MFYCHLQLAASSSCAPISAYFCTFWRMLRGFLVWRQAQAMPQKMPESSRQVEMTPTNTYRMDQSEKAKIHLAYIQKGIRNICLATAVGLIVAKEEARRGHPEGLADARSRRGIASAMTRAIVLTDCGAYVHIECAQYGGILLQLGAQHLLHVQPIHRRWLSTLRIVGHHKEDQHRRLSVQILLQFPDVYLIIVAQ